MVTRRGLALGAAALGLGIGRAKAAEAIPLRLGVLTDMTGVYADICGPGSLLAAKMAAEDFGGRIGDRTIEVLGADHQNKADLGASLARKLYDVDNVAALFDVVNSSIALAVATIARDKNRVVSISGSNTNRLTGDACSPNTAHWAFDNYALAKSTCSAVMATGGDTWFFITADYAFGHDMEQQASDIIRGLGGKVLGSVRHPFPGNTDFSAYLLQAQASGAKVIALANATNDFQNTVKQAAEFGITKGGQRVAGLTTYITDIDALGLQAAQGAVLSLPFYWDLNDDTRSFASRFGPRHGRMPTAYQGAVYSAVTHYLKAARDVGSTDDGRAVMTRMKSLPVEDPIFGHGTLRANGTNVHPMYLFQVKSPAESHARWDYLKPIRETPGDQAYKTLAEAGCSMGNW